MPTNQLRPWSQVVHLHPDVESGSTAVATYAIDLGALVREDATVPAVYRQPEDFFAATHLTGGLRRLLGDVMAALAGGRGDRVLQLRSPFGGGKSHTLAALYHATQRPNLVRAQPGGSDLPDPGPVRVAVFDGEKFGALGDEVAGQSVRTLWGSLAAQLGCYDLMAHYDATRGAPGGDEIARMLGDAPTLILMDEVLKYLERAGAEIVGDSTLGRQAQEFLQTLSTEVANTRHTVLVYSLQASARESFGNTALLAMLDHLTARVDARREPVQGDDVLPVLRRRLLTRAPDPAAVRQAANLYADEITNMRTAQALDARERRQLADEQRTLRDRFEAAYPFHPALIDIMRERWASLPDFQRTRGSLRFLAVCLYRLKYDQRAGVLLAPGDLPLDNSDVAQAFFTEVGQREPFQAVLQRDFYGPNARVNRIDERLARERPDLSGVNPARRIATSILAYSFGGLTTQDAAGGDPIATGVTERELLDAVVGPDLDSITAQGVLKELRDQCLYLHYDGAHYVFKTTPNVTQVLEDQAALVTPGEIDEVIEAELRSRLIGRAGCVLWPRQSQHIPHEEPRFLLAYLPLDFTETSAAGQQQQALHLLKQYGDQPRRYRNGLGLVIPNRIQVETLRRSVRYLKAIELVRGRRLQFNLTQTQLEQLKERERTEKTQRDVALRDLYGEVWLPVLDNGQIAVQPIAIGGWPLQATTVHERFMELLTVTSPRRLFPTITPQKLAELMRLGEEGGQHAVTVGQVIDAFYGVLDFPRLESSAAILRAISAGVREGRFGYVGAQGAPQITAAREAGGYLVDAHLARIRSELRTDEIDPNVGFLVAPAAIAPAAPPAAATTPGSPGIASGGEGLGASDAEVERSGSPLPPSGGVQRPVRVRLALRLTRQQLYNSFNAIGNLAEQAGSIDVTVTATRPDGFDAGWLRNAVTEPLDEADIPVTLE